VYLVKKKKGGEGGYKEDLYNLGLKGLNQANPNGFRIY